MPGLLRNERYASRVIQSLRGIIQGILLAAGLAGCTAPPQPPLRVGTIVWPGHEPLFLARSLGEYRKASIQLVEFPSTVEVIRAYRNRAIDVAGVTADEALSVADSEPNEHRIILVVDVSHGADVVVARPPITALSDLKGRRIAYEPHALGALMLARTLDKAGLSARDVTPVPMVITEQPAAYEAGDVDALVTFEPYTTKLLELGARRLFDSSQIPGEIVDVLLTRADTITQRRETLEQLLEGWFAALRYLRQAPFDAARLMAPREDLSPESFLKIIEGLQLPDAAGNHLLLGDSKDNLEQPLRQLSAIMVEHRLLNRTVDPAPLLDPTLLPAP